MLRQTPNRFRATLHLLACAAMAWVVAGCASEVYSPENAPEYIVVGDFAPFYRLGPQQGRGPDASLRTQTRMKLLRREMGFSFVQLDDLRTGYVPNENIAVAPPRPPVAKPEELDTPAARKRSGRTRGGEPAYSGPPVNDTPLPDRNLPPPDLNVEPEVVPDMIPVVPETPAEPPRFRY